MNILIISVVFPYPADDGGRAGIFKIIDYLRKHNHITLICPGTSEQNITELKKIWPEIDINTYTNDISIPERRLKKYLRNLLPKPKPSPEQLLRNMTSLQATDLINYYHGNLIAVLQKILSKKNFDIIEVDFIELAGLIHFLPSEVKKVFVHHEIRYRRMDLEKETLTNKSDRDDWRIANTRLLETALINQFDSVISLTASDKLRLINDGISEKKIFVSPLPVDLVKHDINQPFTFENKLVFLGPEVHYPNLDALIWFASKIWPLVKKRAPKLEMHVIGRWSEATIRKFKDISDFSFLGYQQNLDIHMKGAIMIVPLRIGSGMRMKILEAASWNMPVISTSIGSEGLPLEHEVNCFIEDEPEKLAEAILKLVGNTHLQQQFSEGTRHLIGENYSMEICGKVREKTFQSVMNLK